MKKNIIYILLFMMFIPLIVKAETCDPNNIVIESITLEEKSENVEELEKATTTGRNINLNLSMLEVGDNIKYKIIVKNNTNVDYELNNNDFNVDINYIDYNIETQDNSTIVKGESSKVIYLNIVYKTEVPEELYKNGTYTDNRIMAVNLSVENKIPNPKTGSQYYLILSIIILIISFIIAALLKKKKYRTLGVLIIGTIIIIPISIYALCKSEFLIQSTIQVRNPNIISTIYRNNDISASYGAINPKVEKAYCLQEMNNGELWLDSCKDKYIGYETKEECENNFPNANDTLSCYYGEIEWPGIGEYVYDPKLLNSEVYIKHNIKGDKIIDNYLCAIIDDQEKCITGEEYSQYFGNMSLFFENVLNMFNGNAEYIEGVPFGNYYQGYSNGHVTITRSDISGAIFMIDSEVRCHCDTWSCESLQ